MNLSRSPIKREIGRVILLKKNQIYYIEAEGDDTLVRTARKNVNGHVEPLEQVEERLPSPPFYRAHRSYIVNLDRVYELRTRGEGEWEVKMDPPVNKVLPVNRRRMDELRGIPGRRRFRAWSSFHSNS